MGEETGEGDGGVEGGDGAGAGERSGDEPIREAGIVAVHVADDGPGVPDGVRGVITGEMEVAQLTHNTGIGLWLVAWIAEAYGGEIAFGPGIDGEGTTVTLRLPAAK